MPTPATSDLPKPKSWDEFEDIVWEIYTRRWQDPHAQRYGRSGQAQHGIDIYGQPNKSDKYVAIQCKLRQDEQLETKEIKSDVIKAEGFSSPISEYIIATTIPRDKKLQDFIRQLNEERQPENKFIVQITFWDNICQDLTNPSNYDLLKKYYPEWDNVFNRQPGIQAEELQYLLSLEIQKDCDLLQEVLDQDDRDYLSEGRKVCFSPNRSVWQDLSSRSLIARSRKELMPEIQKFYQQLDIIEEECQELLALKEKNRSLKSKKKYGGGGGFLGVGTMHPPALASHYFTDSDAIELVNNKKIHCLKFIQLKEVIMKAIADGNKIIHELNYKQS